MALGEDFIQKALETPINTEPRYPFTRKQDRGGWGNLMFIGGAVARFCVHLCF